MLVVANLTQDNEPVLDRDTEQLKLAIIGLTGGMTWYGTKQGLIFWRSIVYKLATFAGHHVGYYGDGGKLRPGLACTNAEQSNLTENLDDNGG
jgi:hypothetical protein